MHACSTLQVYFFGFKECFLICRYLGVTGGSVVAPALAVAQDHTTAIAAVIVTSPTERPRFGYSIIDSIGKNHCYLFLDTQTPVMLIKFILLTTLYVDNCRGSGKHNLYNITCQ